MNELLPLLPTLVSLARTGSVSQTARELGVPRSTVSRRLARLESLLGVVVAERTTHRFRLTTAGTQLVHGAVAAIAQLETTREQVTATSSQVRGQLRVAMPPGISGSFLGWFLAFLHQRHPAIELELLVTERSPNRLEEAFDLILTLGPPEPSPLLRKRVTEVKMMAVASPEYLAARGTPGKLEALEGHALLTLQAPGKAHAWPRLRGGKWPIRPRLVTNDLATLREAAVAGIGIALVPQHLVLADLASETLVHVLPHALGEAVDAFALYLPERRHSPVLKAVLATLADFAKEQLALVA